MKNTHRLLAIVSMVSNALGIVCLSFLLFTVVRSFELLLLGYLLFFVVALVSGLFSLMVKKNRLALVAVIIGVFFLVIYLFVMYQFSYVDFR